jgi:hypothetical protein
LTQASHEELGAIFVAGNAASGGIYWSSGSLASLVDTGRYFAITLAKFGVFGIAEHGGKVLVAEEKGFLAPTSDFFR